MASKSADDINRIVFRLGTRRETDQILRKFLQKFPTDQWNNIIRYIALSVVAQAGPDWDPVTDGFGSIFAGEAKVKTRPEMPVVRRDPPRTSYRPIREEESFPADLSESGNKSVGVASLLP